MFVFRGCVSADSLGIFGLGKTLKRSLVDELGEQAQ